MKICSPAALAIAMWLAPPSFAGPVPEPPASEPSDQAGLALLAKARAAYPSLGEHGFRGYRFEAAPDWSVALAELSHTNPSGYESALKILGQIRFQVRVGAQGQSQVTHNLVDTPEGTNTAGLNQVYAGVEQAINGFFQTWSPFMVQNPIPPKGSPCKVREAGSQVLFSWDEADGVHVDLTTDRAFAVLEMKIAAPAFDAIVRPTFESQGPGLVLVGYVGDYTAKGGAAMTLTVKITNQILDGFSLPAGLDATVHTGGRTERMRILFTGLTAEPKSSR